MDKGHATTRPQTSTNDTDSKHVACIVWENGEITIEPLRSIVGMELTSGAMLGVLDVNRICRRARQALGSLPIVAEVLAEDSPPTFGLVVARFFASVQSVIIVCTPPCNTQHYCNQLAMNRNNMCWSAAETTLTTTRLDQHSRQDKQGRGLDSG